MPRKYDLALAALQGIELGLRDDGRFAAADRLAAANDAIQRHVVGLRQMLVEALEYFENREDCEIDSDGYHPNKEMMMAEDIRRLVE